MIYEHSAGGIVFKPSKGNIEILLIKDKNNNWTFPKGLIEKSESPKEAARREIAEEAGLEGIVLVSEIDIIHYFYRFHGKLINKTVDFFLFQYKGRRTPQPQRKEGISEANWFEVKKAFLIMGYPKSNNQILEKALNLIEQ
ncbi:NUDIX domain-containing protein [Candidatus Microgenomates bacterium]|nr:NUDIX domain-containing protein [Candidatus Microgenomates bacterium]MBI2622145.1 NUDIX domain-containing protein [Candidatus Microgenomates bacterium]